MAKLDVVIPTRNRHEKLGQCLGALALAREHIDFVVQVCDSSTSPEERIRVKAVVSAFPFARLTHHTKRGVAAARNVCAQAAETDLIVNVDDDVYVEPLAIRTLHDAYMGISGAGRPCVIAGTVNWQSKWSTPIKNRLNGYGRPAREGEKPSFLVGAFFMYSRELAMTLPWNERILTADDIFMGALWRAHAVQLTFEPSAKAHHDPVESTYGPEHCSWLIYANLFDSLLADRNLFRAVCYEVWGFAAGAKTYFRKWGTALTYNRAWLDGHRFFVRDLRFLREIVASNRNTRPAEFAAQTGSANL